MGDGPVRAAGHYWKHNERVELLIKNCGPIVEHTNQDRVYYDLGRGSIVMPHREQFTTLGVRGTIHKDSNRQPSNVRITAPDVA